MSFAQLQGLYAGHGIATYPLTENKTPAIRGYARLGAEGSRQLAMKFGEARAVGFVAGSRNRLTVADIDSTDEKLVTEVQGRYGNTPLQVVTPSGGRHLYHRHNGEPRRIRPIPNVDILGAGNVVAAGSIVAKGRYELERGTLDDLDRLPTMRRDNDNRPGRIAEGERNNSLFNHCRSVVDHCDDLDQLLDAARTWAENSLAMPLPAAEIVKTCKSVWTYRGGRKRIMNHVVETDAYKVLKTNPYALALFAYLSAENGPRAEFWIANGLAETLGWPRRAIQDGRRTLLELGIIACTRPRGQGRPAAYRWTV